MSPTQKVPRLSHDAQAFPCEWEYLVPAVTTHDDGRATDVDVHSWMSHQKQLDDRQRPSATIGNSHRQRPCHSPSNDRLRASSSLVLVDASRRRTVREWRTTKRSLRGVGLVVHGGARAERRRGTHGRGSGGAAFPTPCGTRCAWRRPAALPRRVRVALRVRVKVRVRVRSRERTKSSEGKVALGRLQVFCQPLAEQRCPPGSPKIGAIHRQHRPT